MKAFRILSVLAGVIAILFTVATWVLSYLAAGSASSGKCVGRLVVQGYRIEGYFAWPLFSLVFVMIILFAFRSKTVPDTLANFDVPVLELGSLRLTYGAFLIYGILFGFVAFCGLMTEDSAVRYNVVSKYCEPLPDRPNELRISPPYGALGRTIAQPIRSAGWRPFTIRSNARGTSGTRSGNRLAISSGGAPDVSAARHTTTPPD
jgi:hypothetical protein